MIPFSGAAQPPEPSEYAQLGNADIDPSAMDSARRLTDHETNKRASRRSAPVSKNASTASAELADATSAASAERDTEYVELQEGSVAETSFTAPGGDDNAERRGSWDVVPLVVQEHSLLATPAFPGISEVPETNDGEESDIDL